MKKRVLIFVITFYIINYFTAFAQSVGINADGSAPNNSAMLDVSSTNKGFLVPRMTQAQRDLITVSASTTGLLIYQTNNTPGFYYYSGTSWSPVTNLPTWVGSTNITTLGTVTTGVWNAGAVTSSGAVTANSIVKSGGTAAQFLKADGSVDANTYLTAIREIADECTATASQTVFTLSQTPSTNSKLKMYINGVRISNTAYSFTGTSLTYLPANNGSSSLVVGDRIQFDYYW